LAKKELDPCLKHAGTVEMHKKRRKMAKKCFLIVNSTFSILNSAIVDWQLIPIQKCYNLKKHVPTLTIFQSYRMTTRNSASESDKV